MSFGASAVVFHHSKAKYTDLLVLYAVANFIGDDGAWPSIETIAFHARCNETTASKALSRLEQMGEISVIPKGGTGKGVYKTNRYFLLLSCPPDCLGDWNHTLQNDRSRGGDLPPLGVAKTMDKPVIEPVIEPTNVAQSETEQRFSEFWDSYPHRQGDHKKPAKTAFCRLTIKNQKEAIAGAKLYASHPDVPPKGSQDRRFIPMAATWLRQERWNEIEETQKPVTKEVKPRWASS
jgi:hypothetical protein